MKKIFTRSFLLIAVFGLLWTGCKTSSKVAESSKYVGDWLYTFEMEGNSIDAVMTINKVDDGYTGALSSDMGSLDLDDLKIEDGTLTASADLQGYILDIKGTFNGNVYSGTVGADGNEFPMEATRKE